MKKFSNTQIASVALILAGILGAVGSLMNANLWSDLFSQNLNLASESGLLNSTILVWIILPWLSILAGVVVFIPQLLPMHQIQRIALPMISVIWLATELYRQGARKGLDQYVDFYLYGSDSPGAFLIPLLLLITAAVSGFSLLKGNNFPRLNSQKINSALFAIAGLFSLSLYLQYYGSVNEYFASVLNQDGQQARLSLFNFLLVPSLFLIFGVLGFLPKLKLPASALKYAPITLTTLALVGKFAIYELNWLAFNYVEFATPDPVEPLRIIQSFPIETPQQPLWTVSNFLILGLALHSVYRLFSPASGASLRQWLSGGRNFLKALVDSKLDNFISRKVSGVLYIIVTWFAIWATYLEVIYGLSLMTLGHLAGLALIFVMPLALLLALVLIRMVFEASAALIAIAENTKK